MTHNKWNLLMPKIGMQKIIILSILLFTTPFTSAFNTTNQNNWHVEVAPYIWALNMNGTTQIGPARAHVDQTFSDTLSQLNWAAMLWVDANKDKFGIFANIIYSSLSNKLSDRDITVKTKNNFGIYSA